MVSRSLCGLAAIVLSLAACKSDRSGPAPAAASQPPAATPAPAANPVTFTATDYRYSGPSEIPAGLTAFRLENHGKELHHLVIARLEQGRTLDSLLAALKNPGPPPAWLHFVGGPNAAEPGDASNASTMMQPGHYAVMCFIPTAAGVPHVAKGMIGGLEVTPSTGPEATGAAPDLVIKLNDYSFDLSAPLTPGEHTIRGNRSRTWRPGRRRERKDLFLPSSWVASLRWTRGESGEFTVTLEPGDYTLLCFLPDAKAGKPHLMHGMAKALRVG
jgi:uncharacterized cupredoxin-like copper-binding protein